MNEKISFWRKDALKITTLIFLFIFTRFYKIENSLYFFNDMGRDLLVLLKWKKFGQIPLLGPQTSALPINQSPIYFYFLMPFYLITKASPYTALVANAFVYITPFVTTLYLARKSPRLKRAAYLVFFLFIIHPQHILQNRFVWNPSFTPPLLLLSQILLLKSLKREKFLALSVLAGILGVSLNYSVLPIILANFAAVLTFNKRLSKKFTAYSLIFFGLINLPVVAQLFKRLIFREYLIKTNQIYQTGDNLIQKIASFSNYIIGGNLNNLATVGLLLFIFGLAIYYAALSPDKYLKISSQIFLITTLLTIFSPFNLQAHYIFAITTSLFIFIALLNWKAELFLLLPLFYFWLQPKSLKSYIKPAPRTYSQMDSCFQKFCSQFRESLFVSVQSDLYPYHYGPEHRYLMLKNGCLVKNIEENPSSAEYMAVVLDNGTFSQKTRYYELDLFGTFQEVRRLHCQPNFGIVLLKRN
jgi:hypothetical protein